MTVLYGLCPYLFSNILCFMYFFGKEKCTVSCTDFARFVALAFFSNILCIMFYVLFYVLVGYTRRMFITKFFQGKKCTCHLTSHSKTKNELTQVQVAHDSYTYPQAISQIHDFSGVSSGYLDLDGDILIFLEVALRRKSTLLRKWSYDSVFVATQGLRCQIEKSFQMHLNKLYFNEIFCTLKQQQFDGTVFKNCFYS